jgi:hypothetical protein
MYEQLLTPKEIVEYRALLSERISALLEKNKSSKTVDDVASFIFHADHEQNASERLVDLIRIFNVPEAQLDMIIGLVQDAWNYFPHRALDGRSPAEVMAERMTVSKARPRRRKRV